MDAIHQLFSRGLQPDFDGAPPEQRFSRRAMNLGQRLVRQKANFNRADDFLFIRGRDFRRGLCIEFFQYGM